MQIKFTVTIGPETARAMRVAGDNGADLKTILVEAIGDRLAVYQDENCCDEDDEPIGTRGPMHETNDEAMDRWADRYDLNGSPESEEDR